MANRSCISSVNLSVCLCSRTVPGDQKARYPVGDYSRDVAAPHQAAALPQGVQGLLRAVGRRHQSAQVRPRPALHQASAAVSRSVALV